LITKLLRGLAAATVTVMAACSASTPAPAAIDTKHDACRFCRMTVSDVRFAAQIVAPGDEPAAFDDLGCLGDYLRGGGTLRPDAVIFVADHRTREWIRADEAVFTRVATLSTPMSSHLIAHRDGASAGIDPDARGGVSVALHDVVPAPGAPR
jgi:copper chaperone NosL